MRASAVARRFGADFAATLEELPVGEWAGPVKSGARAQSGVHLVWIEQRIEGRQPPLDEIRDRVRREWAAQRRKQAIDELYLSLRAKYDVTVENPERPAPMASAPSTSDSRDSGDSG